MEEPSKIICLRKEGRVNYNFTHLVRHTADGKTVSERVFGEVWVFSLGVGETRRGVEAIARPAKSKLKRPAVTGMLFGAGGTVTLQGLTHLLF